MSFQRHTHQPVPVDEQCGHLTTTCICDHGMYSHLAGGCERCDCQRFEARPCRFRKGKCSATTRMARRREQELEHFEPLSDEARARWHAEEDAQRSVDPLLCGVYFIHCQGFIKIGKTINVRQRLMAHQMSSPFDLELVGFMPCASALLDETEGTLHRRFIDLHHRGEWFRFDEAIRSFLEGIRPENAKLPSASISG